MDIFTIPAANSPEFFQWRRGEFPFFARKTFLTHASVSPLPARTAQAIGDYAARIASQGQFDLAHETIYHRCKERLARLIGGGAVAQEIAFAGSTSHALGLVATSFPWQKGDNCVVADGDFPANVVVWKNLAHTHGVEVRLIPHRAHMDLTSEDLKPFVDDRTRIVSLSAANFLSGFPLDLREIGAFLHSRGVLFCVDAIQMLGAVQLDISEVDFLGADAHKWLLGPNGIAVLWARKSAMERLRPMILGWLATQNRENWFAYDTTPHPTAERFEPGARNYLGIVGFEASLSILEAAGAQNVENRIVALRDYAAQKLEENGCDLLWKPEKDKKSGIVSFQKPGADLPALYQRLEEKFALSLRQDRNGAPWIRVSAHFMNCEADLDELAEFLS